jgi:hypothetical protein
VDAENVYAAAGDGIMVTSWKSPGVPRRLVAEQEPIFDLVADALRGYGDGRHSIDPPSEVAMRESAAARIFTEQRDVDDVTTPSAERSRPRARPATGTASLRYRVQP